MANEAYIKLLRDPRWQKKRLEVLERDGWRCSNCKSATDSLQVHHRRYQPIGRPPWEASSEWLTALCEPCHKKATELQRELRDVLGTMDLAAFEAIVEAAKHVASWAPASKEVDRYPGYMPECGFVEFEGTPTPARCCTPPPSPPSPEATVVQVAPPGPKEAVLEYVVPEPGCIEIRIAQADRLFETLEVLHPICQQHRGSCPVVLVIEGPDGTERHGYGRVNADRFMAHLDQAASENPTRWQRVPFQESPPPTSSPERSYRDPYDLDETFAYLRSLPGEQL